MTSTTSPAMERVLDRLSQHGTVIQKGDNWRCACPAHDDSTPSLDVKEGRDGQVMFQCRSQDCRAAAIAAALGLTMRDLFADDKAAARSSLDDRIVQTYPYRDEAGKVLFQAVRLWAPVPKNKDFRQRRPDDRGGWIWKLDGIRRVVYRLPELLAAPLDLTVFVCEGEKDADRLARCGLVATTNLMGAGKWRKEYVEWFSGRTVVVLADNDDVGRTHAEVVRKSLAGVAASVNVVELPDLPEKGDVSDWIEERAKDFAEAVDWQAIGQELLSTTALFSPRV